MSKRAPYKALRRRYEVSIAKATLEFAESGDNEKIWPAINDRWDRRDDAIFADLMLQDPPASKGEVRELMNFTSMYLDRYVQLGLCSRQLEFLRDLVKRGTRGHVEIESAEDHAKWAAEGGNRTAAR